MRGVLRGPSTTATSCTPISSCVVTAPCSSTLLCLLQVTRGLIKSYKLAQDIQSVNRLREIVGGFECVFDLLVGLRPRATFDHRQH